MPDPNAKPERYDPAAIEPRWQEAWEREGTYRAEASVKPKYYALVEFPYPSGDGLHVGHVRSYTAMDVIARKRRMQGYRVLFPMGWDAFGLPTENFAIKTGIHPAVVTRKNTDTFRAQLKRVGFSFDWSREVNTTDPAFYRWTQWMFIRFFEAGLAYKEKGLINWCPVDKVGLANEEVVAGACERCGAQVEQREKEQWMLRITAYADQLLEGLKDTAFLPEIKAQQENWIGRSEGLVFSAPVKGTDIVLETFNAHFEPFMAESFFAIAPDHPLLDALIAGSEQEAEVRATCARILARRAEDRTMKEVEGAFTGRYAIDPVTGEEMPVWVSSFALANYGTGIVKCSAHDERDFAFAKKYGIPLKLAMVPEDAAGRARVEAFEECFSDARTGVLTAPAEFAGRNAAASRDAIAAYAEQNGFARRSVTYHLRDWVFSRQRYWGEPIPMVRCDKDGWVPVPDNELPLTLPEMEQFAPGPDGESPLAYAEDWIATSCPRCGGPARRETDVMPQWAGSSWYFLRYVDPGNGESFADPAALADWMPVDWYNGGMEHVTLHLLYSRFWNRFLHDQGLVPVAEPYVKRTAHGMVLGEGGKKMSKSKGNVVNPDAVVARHGADTLRVYEMFMGPFNQAIAWDPQSIEGSYRFLARAHALAGKVGGEDPALVRAAKRAARKVSDDIEAMGFNTAVAALMVWVNEATKAEAVPAEAWELFLKALAPFAPHLAEELWHRAGRDGSVHLASWPEVDDADLVEETVRVAVQVGGKARGDVELPAGATREEAEAAARASERVARFLKGATVKKVVYVPGRVISFVL